MRDETKCLHAGYHPKNAEPRVVPIVQSTTYVYDSTEEVAAVFDDPMKSLIYSRFGNPTVMAVEDKIAELEAKGKEATNKEMNIIDSLKIALEATARGIKFAPLSVTESQSKNFAIKDDHTLIPPFRTIDGLGLTVAEKIVEEREKNPFLSIEDLQKRGKVSGTLIEKMRMMHMLDNMDESSQLSLF